RRSPGSTFNPPSKNKTARRKGAGAVGNLGAARSSAMGLLEIGLGKGNGPILPFRITRRNVKTRTVGLLHSLVMRSHQPSIDAVGDRLIDGPHAAVAEG